jgi:hypothetical protein
MGEENEWKTVNRRRSAKQLIPDIATSGRNFRGDHSRETTYFFTDIPDSFGAKAMLNVFQNYGNIIEVVIPAKKDKRGRRFGFARFVNVRDTRSFGLYLDTIIIGRDKIRVNLPRFQRDKGVQRELQKNEGQEHTTKSQDLQNNSFSHHRHTSEGGDKSYAYAVRHGSSKNQLVSNNKSYRLCRRRKC